MSIEVKQFVLNSSVEGNAIVKKEATQNDSACHSSAEKSQIQAVATQQVDTAMAEIRER
jgi:hypothetical protein